MWSWGPVDKEKKRLTSLLAAIAHLKSHGLCSTGIIGACPSRSMAPLIACGVPLFRMGSGVLLVGTTLARDLLRVRPGPTELRT
jgi:hypothetical protein